MAFDPDEYLNETGASSTAKAEFDPDAYLSETEEQEAPFDPDAYLAEVETPAQPKPPVGTSFIEELAAIPQAIKQSIDQPLEAMGETAQVLGASGIGGALRGAIEGPEGYVPAAQRFMEPQEGEFQVAGFAPQFLPRAIVEQAGQIGGAILTRAGGMAIGGLAGSALGPKGTAAGAVAGAFIGPALFEMGQIVGPVARERAANQGREEPTTDDLAWAWSTAGASGALNAIGAKYIPGGDKLTGGLAKRISTAIAGEGSTEGLQSVVQQTGQTFLTEQGFEIKPKEVVGETLIGGGAGGAAVAATAPFTKAAAAAETKVVAEQVAPIAPETAQAVSEQANRVMQEAQVEETTETPEQRVARLQREAQEGVGEIELEEEPPVSGLPPQPVTPTPEAPPVAPVAPVEPVVPTEGAVEPTAAIVPAEPTVERPPEPPVDRSVTILNYDEKAQPIQDQIDNRIDELVEGGMSFEDANNDPSVTSLLDRRLAMDRGAINSYREIVNAAFTEQGITQNDLTINPAQAIIEDVYAAPREGDEGLIASVAERGQEAFDDDAATIRKLSEAIFKYRAEAEGMTPEELLGPNSGLTEEGKQARVDEARISAETIHNQIKNSLLEQAQAQPPEALALPPVTPTPTEVAPTPIAEPPALAPLRRVVKAEQTEEDVSGLVGQGLVELYKGQPVITQAGLETLPEAERPRLTPEARKIQIDTRTSEAAAEAISKNLRIGVDQVPVDVRMPAGWTLVGDIYIPPVVEAAPEVVAPEKRVIPQEQEQVAPVVKVNQEQVNQGKPDIAKIINQFTVLERAAVAGKLLEEGYIDGKTADRFVREATSEKIGGFSMAQIGDAQASADEKFNQQIAAARTSQPVAGEVSPAAVDLEAEQSKRLQSKKRVSPAVALKPKSILGDTAREALAYLSSLNLSEAKDWDDKDGVPKWTKDSNYPKPFYAQIQDAAAILSKLPLKILDADKIISNADRGRKGGAKRFNNGDIGIPLTETARVQTASGSWVRRSIDKPLNVATLVHEVGHTLTADAVNKYITSKNPRGSEYLKVLDTALKNKSTPQPIKDLIGLYKTTIGQLGLEQEYFGKKGLAGGRARDSQKKAFDKKIVNNLTGNPFTWSQYYGLANIDEFVAQTWSSQSFQDLLKQIKAPDQQSIWTKFARIIRDLFGFPSDSMASAVIDLSMQIAELETPIGASRGVAFSGVTVADRIAGRGEEPAPQPEARESRRAITPQQDRDYLDAVERGDLDAASRVVEDAASKAGFTSPTVFHGSIAKGVTRFDVGQAVEVEGGIFFTTNEDVAAQYTFERAYGDIISDEPLGDVTAAKLRMDNPFEYQAKGKIVDAVEMQRVIDQAKADGFDGVIIRNIDDSIGMTGDMGDVYVVFNGNQIKSADAVTRDDAGNIIPPSQRFQPTEADIRYSRTEIRESRREPAPTFTEESPEAKTLSNLKASMDKVDAASEAKGGKPATQKVSDIAANWMESGGDERALQDAITENTNLSPANAAKVARVIAKQYGLQQQIAETGAVIAEIAPEAEGAPRKSSVTKLIEQTTGVRKPVVKFQVSESAALKKQIQLKAREARETRKARKEAAEDLAKSITDYVKANPIRGPINSRQAMSITKRALKLDVNNEAAVDRFEMYVERVIENANYDRDLADARALIKRAKTFAKAKDTQGNVKTTLEAIANVSPTLLDNPFEFNLVVQRYLLGLAPVTAKQYAVMPDADVRRYLESLETQIKANQEVLDRAKAQRILDRQAAYAEEKGIPLDEAISILNSEEFLNEKTIEKLEDLTKLLTAMAQESQKDVRAYDETGATPKQKELISFMRKVNLDSLLNEQKKQYIRSANNLLANGATFGMEQFQSIALGQESVVKALKDKRLSNKLAAWISPIGGDKAIDTARRIAAKTQSEADTFKNIFGRKAVGVFRNILGLNRLDVAQTDSNRAKEQIANEFGEYFKGLRKKYGNDATGFEAKGYAGIAGYLIQTDGNKTEAESIPYRRRLMEQNIVELRKSDKQADLAEADLKERALAQLTGTSNAEILSQLQALNPASYEQLMWVKDVMLPKWRDFLKEHDENFRNQANNYNNPDHLTITYKFPEGQLLPNEIEDVYQQDAIGMRIKQAANSIKRKEHSNLPVSPRTGTVANIDINFGYNQYNALVDQVDKAFVAPAWEQVVAFTKAPEFEQVMGGRANSLFVKKLLTDIQTSRTRQSMTDDEAQMVAGGVRLARKISTQAVLGGFTQPLRQVPDQLTKLFLTTGRWDLITKNLLRIAEAAPLLNKFPIGRRGDAQAGTQYASQFSELARKVEASVTDRKWAQYRELMNRVGEFWMAPLRGSDVWAAKVSWMSYYEAELNKKGIKMESWEREAELVDTDQDRKEAASYAEFAVDFYGGASDPTKMASLSKQTNNGWKEFAKLLFLPLNSFALQQKNSLISDLRDAYLRTGDRKASIAAIAGTLAGMAAFHGMRIYIIGGLLYPAGKALLMGIFGIDMDEPDEEEKQKKLEDDWRKFKASMYGNIVAGGAGEFAEKAAIDAVNKAAYLIQANVNPDELLNDKGEVMSFRQYEKDVSPLYRFRSFGKSEYTFGLADVLTEQAQFSLAETQQIMSPEEMERYTGSEQAYAMFSTMVEWLYFFRLMDTDVTRMARDLKRQMDTQVEEREAEIRAIRNR